MTWTSVFFDEVLFCGMDAAFTRRKIYDTDVSFFDEVLFCGMDAAFTRRKIYVQLHQLSTKHSYGY